MQRAIHLSAEHLEAIGQVTGLDYIPDHTLAADLVRYYQLLRIGLDEVRYTRSEGRFLLKALEGHNWSPPEFSRMVDHQQFSGILEEYMQLQLQYGGPYPDAGEDEEAFEARYEAETEREYELFRSVLDKHSSTSLAGRIAFAWAMERAFAIVPQSSERQRLNALAKIGLVDSVRRV